MHLPAEIINKILNQLIDVPHTKFYPFDSSNSRTRRVLWNDVICTDQQHARQRIEIDQSVLSLRLISREWYQWVTVFIQKYFIWKVDIASEDSLKKALACLPPSTDGYVEEQGIAPTREIVKRLMIKPGKELHEISVGNQSKKWNFRDLLLELFSRLGQVESLILSFPFGNLNDPDVANDMIEALSQCSHQANAFSCIANLQLKVPTTYHAGQAFKAIMGDNPTQLRHLLVEILDSSGRSGSRYFLEASYGEDEDLDGTAEESDDDSVAIDFDLSFNRSPIQRRYPNRRHQQELWNYVSSCTNLETLSIQGTHYLDLDRLSWQSPADFPGLRVLYLGRVYTSISTIKKLVQPSSNISTPRLQKIIIDDVKVPEDGGVWGELASLLLNHCPNLDLFFLYNLSYFEVCGRRAGLSSPDDSTLIDSYEDDDIGPVSELVHTFADKCGSSDTWPFWMVEMGEDQDILEDYKQK